MVVEDPITRFVEGDLVIFLVAVAVLMIIYNHFNNQ